QGHVRFERRFVTEEFVFVSFVRSKCDFDWRIEIHPGDITLVVIVGLKCISTLNQKSAQCFICCKRSSFTQQLCGRLEKRTISFAVRDAHQLAVSATSNDIKE